ncbi:MAG: VOC family protein [Granulosicoccus sp.]|nr:VOC family protein [Granulosicoccus sp.]
MKLDHVALTVADRDKSAKFYARFFDMTHRVHDDEHLLILSNEQGDLLALSEGSKQFELPRTNHFGFRAPDPASVLSAREDFREAGITETEFAEHGPTRLQVLDPDGYRVEIYAF